jgi:hypothetical protein
MLAQKNGRAELELKFRGMSPMCFITLYHDDDVFDQAQASLNLCAHSVSLGAKHS